MDTRTKIITLDKAVEIATAQRTRAVTGYFDPLLAAHAGRLYEIRSAEPPMPLLVVILDPPSPVLGARARAELVSALAVVDYVIILDSAGGEEALSRIPAVEVLREEDADRVRTQALAEHVHRRHQL